MLSSKLHILLTRRCKIILLSPKLGHIKIGFFFKPYDMLNLKKTGEKCLAHIYQYGHHILSSEESDTQKKRKISLLILVPA